MEKVIANQERQISVLESKVNELVVKLTGSIAKEQSE